MTTAKIRRAVPSVGSEPSTAATPILDWMTPRVRVFAAEVDAVCDDLSFLRAAHRLIQVSIRPVYAMTEVQPVSETLRKERGSCSQRLAVLEAVARSRGIATRVQGLLIDGEFWYPRFPTMTRLVPHQILLAWPEFRIGSEWLNVSRLFSGMPEHPDHQKRQFTNSGGETLFDAIARGAADWAGEVTDSCDCGDPDLARFVRRELGVFGSRDEVFARYGQNLPALVRALVDPVFSRWSAQASVPLVSG